VKLAELGPTVDRLYESWISDNPADRAAVRDEVRAMPARLRSLVVTGIMRRLQADCRPLDYPRALAGTLVALADPAEMPGDRP
jgi:hypothetical protein